METICPACGGKMETSVDEFSFNQHQSVKGVQHQVCQKCGEMAFTADQSTLLFDYLQALKQVPGKDERARH